MLGHGDQPVIGCIPKDIAATRGDVADTQHLDLGEQVRVGVMTGGQAVVGDALAEVVYVVVADVGGEPVQDARQLEVARPLQGSGEITPTLVTVGVRIGEVVLDVENADEDRRSDRDHRRIQRPEETVAHQLAAHEPRADHADVVA